MFEFLKPAAGADKYLQALQRISELRAERAALHSELQRIKLLPRQIEANLAHYREKLKGQNAEVSLSAGGLEMGSAGSENAPQRIAELEQELLSANARVESIADRIEDCTSEIDKLQAVAEKAQISSRVLSDYLKSADAARAECDRLRQLVVQTEAASGERSAAQALATADKALSAALAAQVAGEADERGVKAAQAARDKAAKAADAEAAELELIAKTLVGLRDRLATAEAVYSELASITQVYQKLFIRRAIREEAARCRESLEAAARSYDRLLGLDDALAAAGGERLVQGIDISDPLTGETLPDDWEALLRASAAIRQQCGLTLPELAEKVA